MTKNNKKTVKAPVKKCACSTKKTATKATSPKKVKKCACAKNAQVPVKKSPVCNKKGQSCCSGKKSK